LRGVETGKKAGLREAGGEGVKKEGNVYVFDFYVYAYAGFPRRKVVMQHQ